MEKNFKINKKDYVEQLSKIANSLKNLRKENNLTQKDVASILEIRYQSYQAYERGIAYPSLENFIKLSILFKVSLDYLIGKDLY